MPTTVSPFLLPILMLLASNIFMTFAWYGHLKFKEHSLPLVIMVSWGIAFFEYWLAVPANRWGSAVYSAAQLKTMQEVITLVVFAGFSVLYLKEPLGWNHAIGFAFIAAGAFFIFHVLRLNNAAAPDRRRLHYFIYSATLMPVGPRMTTNSTGRKKTIIGTVSFGGRAAAFFSASFMRMSRFS